MKLNKNELNRIIEDLSQCERRDKNAMARSTYTESSKTLAKERQDERSPLLTRLRLAVEDSEEVTA